MKHLSATLVVSLLVLHQLAGQLGIGLTGGVNVSNVKVTDISTESRTAPFFGISAAYSFTNKLTLRSDFQYSVKGFIANPSRLEHRYRYIDILPELEYRIHQYIGVGIGTNIGFLLDEAQKFGDQDWIDTSSFGTIKSSDFGVFGAIRGYYKNFSLVCRYNAGVADVNDVEYRDDQGMVIDFHQYNRNWQFGLAYTYLIPHRDE